MSLGEDDLAAGLDMGNGYISEKIQKIFKMFD